MSPVIDNYVMVCPLRTLVNMCRLVIGFISTQFVPHLYQLRIGKLGAHYIQNLVHNFDCEQHV
jgi:hypothetical protein